MGAGTGTDVQVWECQAKTTDGTICSGRYESPLRVRLVLCPAHVTPKKMKLVQGEPVPPRAVPIPLPEKQEPAPAAKRPGVRYVKRRV